MQVSTKIYEKKFENTVSKKAYLKLCGWLAKYILSSDTLSEKITYKVSKEVFEKVEYEYDDDEEPTLDKYVFTLELFVSLNYTEHKNHYCDKCKEFHKSFFIDQDYNCNECRVTAMDKQSKSKLSIMRSAYRKDIKQYIEKIHQKEEFANYSEVQVEQ